MPQNLPIILLGISLSLLHLFLCFLDKYHADISYFQLYNFQKVISNHDRNEIELQK